MAPGKQPSTTLQRFFAGIAEHTFQVQLGLVDPDIIDYLSDLLMRFVRMDSVARVRSTRGRPLLDVAALLVEADQRIGSARRDIHRHIGDFTLFWAGLFPEALRPRPGREHLDRFVDYCHHGKRAYLIASSIEVEEEDVPGTVLERLGEHFEMCAYGLREVRREWEERRDDDLDQPGPFLIN